MRSHLVKRRICNVLQLVLKGVLLVICHKNRSTSREYWVKRNRTNVKMYLSCINNCHRSYSSVCVRSSAKDKRKFPAAWIFFSSTANNIGFILKRHSSMSYGKPPKSFMQTEKNIHDNKQRWKFPPLMSQLCFEMSKSKLCERSRSPNIKFPASDVKQARKSESSWVMPFVILTSSFFSRHWKGALTIVQTS